VAADPCYRRRVIAIRPRTAALLSLALAASACRERRTAAPPPATPAQVTAAVLGAAVVSAAGAAAAAAPICGDRSPCTEVERLDAGKDTAGRPMAVVKLALGKEVEPGADEEEVEAACQPYETWLVIGEAAAPEAAQLLVVDCNDGYGAAGVGEDSAEVAPNLFTHARSGGSSWRWDVVERVQLSPVALIDVQRSGSWNLGDNEGADAWSWADFRGAARGTAIVCGADGEPPGLDDDETSEAGELPYRYLAIPQVALPDAVRDGAWRTISLGRCAAAVDAAAPLAADGSGDLLADRGYVIHGEPGAAADSAMKVVAGADGRTLYVEITDDVWKSGGKRWIDDDHLELWLAEEKVGYMETCVDRAKLPPARQWGIRISDGKVFPAAGKPKAPLGAEVEPPRDGGPARLKLTLPEGHPAITVVYSDSDDGVRQERLIATSAFAFGKVSTLGALYAIPEAEAVCDLDGKQLVPRRTRTVAIDEPIAGAY
jgi:hypothetical protein